MLAKLERGCGVEFSVIGENGQPTHFRLAVIAEKSWYRDDREELSFGFVSDDNAWYSRGCYSGGVTGFGQDRIESMKEKGRVVTTDLDEIIKMGQAAEKAALDGEAQLEKEKELKVARINDLPRFFSTGSPVLDKYLIFKRMDASYNGARSRRIQGGDIRLVGIDKKDDEKNYTYIHPQDYKSRGGALQAKKFRSLLEQYGIETTPKGAKILLVDLLAKYNELKKMITEV